MSRRVRLVGLASAGLLAWLVATGFEVLAGAGQ
jgi:hypothetical protein